MTAPMNNNRHDSRLLENLEYNLGETVMNALRDPEVVEVILNSDGKIWIERLGTQALRKRLHAAHPRKAGDFADRLGAGNDGDKRKPHCRGGTAA